MNVFAEVIQSLYFPLQRYIELNPVRVGMVEHSREYRWASYRTNAQGESTVVLSPHLVHLDLGRTEDERHTAYCELFRFT
ncbi:hypothetical protein [Desulfotalea psychrophila]|uniref:hypothetical protein n=1 Tax=Desulfotalea psychrophila TaxID=84980 RepID=UPI0012EAFBD3|nr:hypothetical protein [Desulfotalea psychrophila]